MPTRCAMFTPAVLAGALMVSPAAPAHAEAAPPPDDWGTQVVARGSNGLAVNIYRELAGQAEGDNVFFSPLSISAALSLTYEGAVGDTMREFEHVLGIPSDTPGDWGRPQYHQAMSQALGLLDGADKPYELSVANALYGEQTMPFNPRFVAELDEHYDAGLELVDFKGRPDAQRERINQWVAERTHDRIQGLMPEGSVDPLTRLVLVNALYFKARWANTFSERATQDAAFYLLPDEAGPAEPSVQVPLMRHHEERFAYGDFDGYDALELRYQGRDLSMLVLLPDTRDGLAALEAQLSHEMIAQTLEGMSVQTANVWLPKWEMTLDYDLIPVLQALGMERAFDAERADFRGICDSAEGEELYITGVFHKAFIAVDEAGTEAAAATAVAVGALSAAPPREVVDFRADHPFVYFIRDNRSGVILFMGRVTDPS